MATQATTTQEAWPPLPLEAWQDTYATLHRWMQIAGKIRLVQSPWLNHSWHATLYPTATGLTTSTIPHGNRTFQIDFDFVAHRLTIRTSEGRRAEIALEPMSVATFCRRVHEELAKLDLRVKIRLMPCEIADAVPFDQDEEHRAYDPEYANRYWRVLVQAARVFNQFRARYIGKSSPVHFFWGAPDLAVTRFSGRLAPPHPGGVPGLPDWVAREAYSHEVASAGFWAGGGPIAFAAFYAYAYPEPPGFAEAQVRPDAAFYSTDLKEFILPYDAVREAADPDATLLDFLQSTYEAAADCAGWDRGALERAADWR